MLKEHAQVNTAGCGRVDILTQLFVKHMTLTMTLNWLSRTHFIPRINDSQRKNKQKNVKVHITANTEEGQLRNKSENRFCYSPYNHFVIWWLPTFTYRLQLILIYYRIYTVCKCGLSYITRKETYGLKTLNSP